MPHSPHGLLEVPPGAAVVPLANPTHLKKSATHFSQSTPIFQKFPSPGDISQGAIGNCWQLAAINACLSRPEGPAAIMELMVDKGGGKVIVRLYVNNAWRYYQVEKSTKFGFMKNLSGALWVNILEKALIMTISTGDYDQQGSTPLSAMTALLGPHGHFKAGATDQRSTLMAVLKGCANDERLYVAKQAALKGYALEMFGGSESAFARFAQWNKSASKGYSKFINSSSALDLTLDNLRTHLLCGATPSPRSLDADLRGMIEAWAVGMSAVETAGRYDQRTLQMYREIARAIATQHAVTTETDVKLPGRKGFFDSFSSGTVGEGRVAGIYTTHAYTVTGVESRRGYLGIIVRNPHGKNNRGYDWNSDGSIGQATSIGAAEGWIELNDYMQTFSGYSATASVASAGRKALMEQISGPPVALRPPPPPPRSHAVPPPPPPRTHAVPPPPPTRPRR